MCGVNFSMTGSRLLICCPQPSLLFKACMQQNSFSSYAASLTPGLCVKHAASATPKDGIWTGLLSFLSDTA